MEELMNWLPFVATGIYAWIYLQVNKTKKAEIEMLKSKNTELERYSKIFNLDDVEKQIELREKNIILEVKLAVNDNELLKTKVSEQIGVELQKEAQGIDGKITEEYIEAMVFIKQFAKSLPLEKQINLVENFFPKSKSHTAEFLGVSAHIKN